MRDRFQRYDGHRPLTKEDLNQRADTLELLARLTVSPPLSIERLPGGVVIGLVKDKGGFWARLTAEASDAPGYYSWIQLDDDAKTEAAPELTGTDNAKEVNKTEAIDVGEVDVGAVVRMWLDASDPSRDPDQPEYRFEYSRPSFWAKIDIDGEIGSGAYTFTEQWPTSATAWADKTDGRTGTAYEVNDVEGIADGTIIDVTVEHDTSGVLRYVFDYSGVEAAVSTRVVKIVSYATGVYVVQPVVRTGSAWANNGSQLTGIHNYGEVQTEEAGYLAGPGGEDIYVPLFTAGDESFMLEHPPRMV